MDPISFLTLAAVSCALLGMVAVSSSADEKTFTEDVAFLGEHVSVVELAGPTGRARVAVVPAYQGRVMTSTATGSDGDSFGWINYGLIEQGEVQPKINVYGGEDRFWLGPEGGQFSLFFRQGEPFDLEHWQTPALIDTEPFELARRDADSASFHKEASVTNYAGTVFSLEIDRTVRLLSVSEASDVLGIAIPESVAMVGYESKNVVGNAGREAWTKSGGLLSVWILGMYKPSLTTTIAVPFEPGPEEDLGPRVNDAYFGKIPEDRLKVGEGMVYFKGDGRHRGKIGIGPRRALPTLGSYDENGRVLTIVQYARPEGALSYVNSMWEIQDEPFAGDVVNSYNDGPPAPGQPPLGPFYELETSSPALELTPGATATHVHRTFHIQGEEAKLNRLCRKVLGVGLDDIKAAF